jgi:tRNA pseudouridine55 synthase
MTHVARGTPHVARGSSHVALEGVLVIDKPVGPTSHDVVARVRHAIGMSRVGHTGTLDPLASGVLPLVVGRATRLAQFLSASDKEYIAEVRLGATSETYDAEGPLTPAPPRPPETPLEAGGLEEVLSHFRGTYAQMPPPYSAKKVGGTRAYKLARRHQPIELTPVPVTVHALETIAIEVDLLRIRVACSTGCYVRTLAHEIGARLGVGAYLTGLRRTRVGAFTLADTVPLEDVQRGGLEAVAGHMTPMDRLLPDLPAVVLSEAGVRRVSHGNVVTLEYLAEGSGAAWDEASSGAGEGAKIRLLDASGTLVGIAEWRAAGLLHPTIVLV